MSGLLHFIRKFVKCNRNPLIPNLLHLHELVIGIASVRSRSPVSGLGGRAKRPACGRAKRPAWGVEPSVQLGVEPSVQLGSEPSVQLGGSSQASSLGSVVGHLFPDLGRRPCDGPRLRASTRFYYTCMNYCTQVRLLRDLLHLHELVIGNVAFISE